MSSPQEPHPSTKKAGKKFNWGLVVKLVLTAAILYVIFRKINLATFVAELKNAHVFWVILASLSMGTGICLGSLRWNWLLRVQGINLTYRKTAAFTFIGAFFSLFLPASTGGDVIKIFYILKEAPDRKARAALSILLDRVMGLLGILIFTLLLVPFEYEKIMGHAEIRLFIFFLAALVVSIFAGLLALWFVPPSSLPSFCHKLWKKLPKKDIFLSLYEGFQAHRQSRREAATAVLIALLAVVPVLSTGYFVAQSLQLDVGYPQMTIIFSLVLCSISLPISFGGHGLREGAFIFLFHLFNITRAGVPVEPETATACSIIFLGIGMVWAVLGGIVYLLYSHNAKKIP